MSSLIQAVSYPVSAMVASVQPLPHSNVPTNKTTPSANALQAVDTTSSAAMPLSKRVNAFLTNHTISAQKDDGSDRKNDKDASDNTQNGKTGSHIALNEDKTYRPGWSA